MGSSLPAPPMPFGLPPPPGMPGFNPLDPTGSRSRGASPAGGASPARGASPAGGALQAAAPTPGNKAESPGASGIRAKRVRTGFSYGSLPGNGGAGRGAFGTLLGGGMPGGRTLLGG